jgi:hypothetical protein
LIESGSHTLGVRSEDFGLPAGTALRYEQPAEPLRTLLPGYAVLDSEAALWSGPGNWVLPSWAMLWIGLAPDPMEVRIGARQYGPLGSAMLFGVTSRAMPASTYGGVSVVVHISPLAWARLFAPSAEQLRDRITPLDQLLSREWGEDLVSRLAHSDRGPEVKGVLDEFFLHRMPPPHPQEQLIATIAAFLVDETTHDPADAVAEVGIDKRSLLRLT